MKKANKSRSLPPKSDAVRERRPPVEHDDEAEYRKNDQTQMGDQGSGDDKEQVVGGYDAAPEGTPSEALDTDTMERDDDDDEKELTEEMGYSSGDKLDVSSAKREPADIAKTGVIFCSRVPPFMSLSKLRSYFSRYGKIGRIYAEPESVNDYKRRVKMGGNKKLKFIHGWIEFMDKTTAKRVAAMLNGQPVGEKKRHNFWRDDLWNLLYLPKYKFHDVMAYLREHKNDRKEKLSFHLANARKENYNYMEQLEAEKQHKAIESKRRKQGLPAFKHKAKVFKKEEKPKKEENSEDQIPLELLGAIVT